jgi:hypothetical protein
MVFKLKNIIDLFFEKYHFFFQKIIYYLKFKIITSLFCETYKISYDKNLQIKKLLFIFVFINKF